MELDCSQSHRDKYMWPHHCAHHVKSLYVTRFSEKTQSIAYRGAAFGQVAVYRNITQGRSTRQVPTTLRPLCNEVVWTRRVITVSRYWPSFLWRIEDPRLLQFKMIKTDTLWSRLYQCPFGIPRVIPSSFVGCESTQSITRPPGTLGFKWVA